MRNHTEKFERFECGEGPTCRFGFESLIAPLVGGAFNLLSADDRTTDPQQQVTQNPWGPSIPAAQNVLDESQQIYDTGGFAPIANQLELLGRANQLGYAEDFLPDLIGSAQESWMRGLDPGLDPYVGQMIQSAQNDLVQDYQRNIMPSISMGAQATGGYGGSRQGVAEGIASEGLLEALGDTSTRLLSDAYGQSLGQQRAAWGAAPGMTQLGYGPSQAQQQVGAQYRSDIAQPAQNLAGFQQTTLPYFTAGYGVTGSPNPYYQSPSQIALGGAAAGQQLWNDISGSFNTGSSGLPPASPLGGTGAGGGFLLG